MIRKKKGRKNWREIQEALTEELVFAFALVETVTDSWKFLGPSYRIIK